MTSEYFLQVCFHSAQIWNQILNFLLPFIYFITLVTFADYMCHQIQNGTFLNELETILLEPYWSINTHKHVYHLVFLYCTFNMRYLKTFTQVQFLCVTLTFTKVIF